MKQNLGTIDRWARVVLAALGGWLAAAVGFASPGGVLALVAAGILVVTALLGSCPLYALLGISTRRAQHRPVHG
jgi:hypothetical protein